jgi:hypothetical protein
LNPKFVVLPGNYGLTLKVEGLKLSKIANATASFKQRM